MSAQLHVVTVELGTAAARALAGANNPDRGVLVAPVVADLRRRYELGWSILEALGKRADVTGAGRDEDIDWELLPAWFAAHRIRHLVLTNADRLQRRYLADLAGLAAVSGVELWLLAADPYPAPFARAISAWPVRNAEVDELAAILPNPADDVTSRPFPRVPWDNFTVFRAAARRQLDGDDFAIVDARFCAAFDAATGALGGPDLDEAAVVDYLRSELLGCATTDEIVTTVRAVQAAAFRLGWLVQVDPLRLAATAERVSDAAIHEPDTWRRLRAYREPYRGCVCALAGADLAIGEIQSLTLDDVDADHSSVTVDGRHVQLPTGADVFVRAHVQLRRSHGAHGTDPLFANDNGPMRDRYLEYAVRAPILEVGVAVLTQAFARARVDSGRWLHRYGVSVQAL